jgi:PAS domain-containing protein
MVESEIARQSLTGSDNTGRDMSMTPSDLSGIIYHVRDRVLLVELQGTVVAANPGASRLFQRPSDHQVLTR